MQETILAFPGNTLSGTRGLRGCFDQVDIRAVDQIIVVYTKQAGQTRHDLSGLAFRLIRLHYYLDLDEIAEIIYAVEMHARLTQQIQRSGLMYLAHNPQGGG